MDSTELFNFFVSRIRDAAPELAKTRITRRSNPIDHLGLDSLTGLEILVDLPDYVLDKIPDSFSPFVAYTNSKARGSESRTRTLGEAIGMILLFNR